MKSLCQLLRLRQKRKSRKLPPSLRLQVTVSLP
jgi:hypothetical protein